MSSLPKIAVLVGPTASGKTKLAVALAHRFNGEVVSADSMQIYRRMDIGTAKPTAEEMEGIPHHMLDVAEPDEDYSVARYVDAASACITEILARGRLPIVAGGTGLYIDSLLERRSFAPQDPKCREELQRVYEQQGIAPLLEELRQVDPGTAARLHERDTKRILRALEVYRTTGTTITEQTARNRSLPPRYDAAVIGLGDIDRRNMWSRIDRRVGQMMRAGLAEEVRALLASGVPADCTSMQAIGYKELARAAAEGRDPESAAEEVRLRTRQYAKRQLTWFRRREGVHWYLWGDTPDFEACLRDTAGYLNFRGL